MINIENLNQDAFISAKKKYNYSELIEQIGKLTNISLKSPKDKIAIFSKNSAKWIFAFYSGWNAGKTVIPIDFLASTEDIVHIINDCEPGLIFIDNTTIDKWNEALLELKNTITIFNLSNFESIEKYKPIKWNPTIRNEDTAVIIYTSGTTGLPKGVMLSFKNLIANINAVSRDVKIYKKNQEVLMLLPLHHIFPLAGSMIIPLYVGGTIVESPSMQSSELMATFANNKVGLMIGVPKLYHILYQGIKDKLQKKRITRILYKFVRLTRSKKLAKTIFKQIHTKFGGNLKFMISGGAAIDPKVSSFFNTLGFNILEGYGMTEAAPMITFTRPGKFKAGSPGQILPNLKVKIIDEEIVVKGSNVMKGYYNRPEETADILKDGWLYTGDLGKLDKKNFLTITGRRKEIIVLPSGKNINPILLEQKLNEVDIVIESGVFLHKGFLHALIVTNMELVEQKEITDLNIYFRKDVLPKFNQQVTSYKRIMKFAITEKELPRTRLGKLQRFKFAELFTSPIETRISEKYNEEIQEYQVIKTFIEQQVDMNVAPNHHIEFDIALDSLDKLSLMEFIDKTFGVKISEDKLHKFPSISKMADYIREHKLFHKIEMPDWSAILKERVHLRLPKSWFGQILVIKSLKYMFFIIFRVKSRGKENIPEGPAIIAPNHQSFLDAIFITAFIKNKELRQTFFYAKKDHVKSKFMTFLANKHNVIVMDIDNGVKESIQKLAEVLKQNKKVVIFPEGTRTKDGKLGDFKKTFAILSKELNIPIIPVAINGAHRALPKGKHFPRLFAKVHVTYKSPVYPEKYDLDSLTSEVKKRIDEEIDQIN